MKSRRWFVTPELLQWRYMVATGYYQGHFFDFPKPGSDTREKLFQDHYVTEWPLDLWSDEEFRPSGKRKARWQDGTSSD